MFPRLPRSAREREQGIGVFLAPFRARRRAWALLRCCIMSTKSKRRGGHRAHPAERSSQSPAQPNVNEKRVAGAIIGALLDAITFGALDASAPSQKPPQSHRRPPSQRTPQPA
jgi:hypothetical protein